MILLSFFIYSNKDKLSLNYGYSTIKILGNISDHTICWNMAALFQNTSISTGYAL